MKYLVILNSDSGHDDNECIPPSEIVIGEFDTSEKADKFIEDYVFFAYDNYIYVVKGKTRKLSK